MKCMLCIRAQRRYGKLDFSRIDENFPNKAPLLGCPSCYPSNNNRGDNNTLKYVCAFCIKDFSTATRLYLHTSLVHNIEDNILDNEWDFYTIISNSIMNNLNLFYYDRDKLNRLSNLISGLQTNIGRKKQLSTIQE